MTVNDPLFTAPAEAAAPLATLKPPLRRTDRRQTILLGAAGAGGLVILVLVWRLIFSKGSPINDPPVTPVRDADPAIVAPALGPLRKPKIGDDLLPSASLDARLAAIAQKAAQLPDDDDTAPPSASRANRWEIRFPSDNTPDAYAKQLDALGIELGVVGDGPTIHYASRFTDPKPSHRDGPAAAESRVYMTWLAGHLRDLDTTLLGKAGVSVGDHLTAQFYPEALENHLAELELQFAGKQHKPEEISRTVFELRAADNGYELVVVEQEYDSGEVKTLGKKPDKEKPAEKPAEKATEKSADKTAAKQSVDIR